MADSPSILDLARRAVAADISGQDAMAAIGHPRDPAMAITRLCHELVRVADAPIPMRLTCPACNTLHVDEGEFATRAHHTHACQECGAVWRPAVVATVGVRFLPGFKNPEALK